MKKTLLAMVVPALLASGAASAVTLYDNEGTKLDLVGSMRIMAEYNDSRASGNHDTKIKDQGSRFGVRISRELGNDLRGFGYMEYGNDTQSKEDDFKLKNRLGYIGLELKKVGDIQIGRVMSPFDNVAHSDYTYEYGGVLDFGNNTVPKHHNNNYIGRVSNSVRVMSAEFSGFSVGGTYTLQDEDSSSVAANGRPIFTVNKAYTLAAFYNTDFGLNLSAGYGSADYNAFRTASIPAGYNAGDSAESDILGVSAEYVYDALSVALDYGQASLKSSYIAGGSQKQRANLYGVGAKYSFGKPNVYAGFYVKDGRKNIDNNHYVTSLGADYRFTTNYRIWLEYAGIKDRSSQGKVYDDNKVALGLRVFF